MKNKTNKIGFEEDKLLEKKELEEDMENSFETIHPKLAAFKAISKETDVLELEKAFETIKELRAINGGSGGGAIRNVK